MFFLYYNIYIYYNCAVKFFNCITFHSVVSVLLNIFVGSMLGLCHRETLPFGLLQTSRQQPHTLERHREMLYIATRLPHARSRFANFIVRKWHRFIGFASLPVEGTGGRRVLYDPLRALFCVCETVFKTWAHDRIMNVKLNIRNFMSNTIIKSA